MIVMMSYQRCCTDIVLRCVVLFSGKAAMLLCAFLSLLNTTAFYQIKPIDKTVWDIWLNYKGLFCDLWRCWLVDLLPRRTEPGQIFLPVSGLFAQLSYPSSGSSFSSVSRQT